MATIVKQWNWLPGRNGESLFCLLHLARAAACPHAPCSCGETHQRIAFSFFFLLFFRLRDFANLAQEIPICSCLLPEIQPDPCKIAAGRRAARRKREGGGGGCTPMRAYVRVCTCVCVSVEKVKLPTVEFVFFGRRPQGFPPQ